MTLEDLRKGGYVLNESQWMTRILFLETIAGVPGFFAAMIRHLKGLRSLVRRPISSKPQRVTNLSPHRNEMEDGSTLYSKKRRTSAVSFFFPTSFRRLMCIIEVHLMTFMTLRDSSIFFRAFIVVAQGVFANAFFLGYLLSPRTMHRFVGALEEEATIT